MLAIEQAHPNTHPHPNAFGSEQSNCDNASPEHRRSHIIWGCAIICVLFSMVIARVLRTSSPYAPLYTKKLQQNLAFAIADKKNYRIFAIAMREKHHIAKF